MTGMSATKGLGGTRRAALVVLAAIALTCSACQPSDVNMPTPTGPASTARPPVTLALVGGALIDGTGAPAIENAVVLISGDRILAAGSASAVRVPAGVRTIDVHGGTILPGFINAHVHRGFSEPNLSAWAAGGVTTVRDESTSSSQVAGLRDLRARIGRNPGLARLISAGSMLGLPGGYGDLTVDSTDAALQAVDQEIDQGADAVKVALEDGYAGRTGLPKPSPEFLRAVVQRAHSRGLPVSGHLTQAAYVQGLLDAGVDDIGHVPYDAVPDAVLRQMVDQGVYLVPTFTVFRNYGANVDGCADNVRRFVALGGKVALGNDYGGGPGEFELGIPMYEIETMATAGMTPMQVIQAATLNAAHVVGLDGVVGTVTAGRAADILVVGGNPLDDIQVLRNVRTVVHAGVEIRSDASAN